jgi:hypothetical protein
MPQIIFTKMTEYNEKQIHILIGCADARDLNQVQIDSVNETIKAFKGRGIHVEMRLLRVAGSFVTPDVVTDIKRIIDETQRDTACLKITYFVHIQSHGDLDEESEKNYISHVHDLRVIPDSPLNCGMLKASSVGVEIEEFIIKAHPKVNIKGEIVEITSEKEIRKMLAWVYGYDGYLAGDWIRGIDYLRTHPRAQRASLERTLATDIDFKNLDIKVTAGIQDYTAHALIRVDGGEPEVDYWDTMQLLVRKKVKESDGISLAAQADKQEPLAGLLCMPDPRVSSRTLAAQYYRNLRGCGQVDDYLPNTVFNMTGSAFDVPLMPFGPYVIAGFYYSIKYLNLLDQMVMGYDQLQTNRIVQKIYNDPIMNLIVDKFKVNLLPINHVDLMAKK